MEENNVHLQTFIVKMKMPGGEKRIGRFMGLSLFTPGEFEDIAKKVDSLEELFVENEQCIVMGKPQHIEQAITGEGKGDIVKMVRNELKREHHEKLKEDEN